MYHKIEISHRWFADAPLPKKRYLSPLDALALLHFAETRRSPNANAVIAIALGAFAGLNILEIVRIRAGDVDLDAGTVTIVHSKNRHRERIIPVLPRVIDSLRPFVEQKASEDLLIHSPGDPTYRTISRNLIRRLLPAARKELALKLDINSKDLRKTFVNMLDPAGTEERWQEAYIGHAEYSTIRRHYKATAVDLLRSNVVVPLQEYLRAVQRARAKYETVAPGVVQWKEDPEAKTRRFPSLGDLIDSGEIPADEDARREKLLAEMESTARSGGR